MASQTTRATVFDVAWTCAIGRVETAMESPNLKRDEIESVFAELKADHHLTGVALRFVQGDIGLRAIFEPVTAA